MYDSRLSLSLSFALFGSFHSFICILLDFILIFYKCRRSRMFFLSLDPSAFYQVSTSHNINNVSSNNQFEKIKTDVVSHFVTIIYYHIMVCVRRSLGLFSRLLVVVSSFRFDCMAVCRTLWHCGRGYHDWNKFVWISWLTKCVSANGDFSFHFGSDTIIMLFSQMQHWIRKMYASHMRMPKISFTFCARKKALDEFAYELHQNQSV